MADNIKIVGNILQTQQIPRYSEKDTGLLSPIELRKDFGVQGDYIEYFIYDVGGNLLYVDYNYKDFKLPVDSYINPSNDALPIIEIDPVKDIQNVGYTSGEFKTRYNFFTNKISNYNRPALFIQEISSDRTELRTLSTILTNDQIEKYALDIIDEYTNTSYFVDYILNFGDNKQAVVVNIALNKVDSGYEILFKLYEPLLETIREKDIFWVVEEKVNPYTFDINLDKLITPPTGSQLRGPNFSIEIPNQNNIGTSYQSYESLISAFQNVSSSYQQLLNLIISQSIDINTDYSSLDNFIFFSSAESRINNFYEKIKEIENYNNIITTYTPLTSSKPNLVKDINTATASINDTIANFDGFEYYLYFESGSLSSTPEYGMAPYPKITTTKPYQLYPYSSTSASIWYNTCLIRAENYDNYNSNKLTYTVPSFILEDENNAPYLTFLDMVGHYFDNIWIYLQAITNINLANNNLEKGVSKDLVYTVLQSLGTKLYNKYGNSENDLFLIGKNSGSVNFDNDFTPTGSYLNNIPRKDLLAETYKRIYHNLPLLLKTKGTTYGLQTLVSTFGITSSILNVKEYGGNLKTNTLDEYNTDDKVRIFTNTIYTGSVLSPHVSLQIYPSASLEFRTNDYHYVDVSFSPQSQIDTYASASISSTNSSWSLDDFIGDPGYIYSSSYSSLDIERNIYYDFNPSYMDYAGFIRLIQFFDNSLFKMIKDFVPARANLSTGITINSPVLERNKFVYANPTPTSKIEVNEGIIEGPIIGTEYTDIYQHLTGSRAAYYTGEFEGDVVDYSDVFDEVNFNPYLFLTSSLTPSDLNVFYHSDFNVLLNNVSASRLSGTRRLLQAIYRINSPLSLAGYSSSYFAELQDSYESLKSYQSSRYEGTKISSLKYNTYSTASSTYVGDISFGKEPTINKNVRKLGLFNEIVTSSFLPNRNKVALKYLVDEKGNITELNQRNKNWHELQRIFVTGDYLNVSQFNNQKFSNQLTTDGDKLIFDSGYSYYPILYFGSCNIGGDSKIYFESLGGFNSYLVTANNGNRNRFISGSSSPGIPVEASTGRIYNIFTNEIDPNNIFTTGTLSSFPIYNAAESGDYRAEVSFDLTVNMPSGGSSIWALNLLKDGVLQSSDLQLINISVSATASAQANILYSSTINTLTAQEVYSNKPILIGSTTYAAGEKFYKWDYGLLTSSTYPPDCNFSPSFTPWYSTYVSTGTVSNNGKVCSDAFYIFEPSVPFYLIPDFDTPSAPQTRTFTINRSILNPITNVPKNGQLTLEFSQSYLSTNNYTASLSLGSLSISSLAVATGYASTVCSYFSSSSLSASIANNDRSTITLSSGLSNFYNKNYQFVPNPLTGSQNSLYLTYGDVDYPFVINPQDIVLTYLSDDTYVESKVSKISISDSGSLQIGLDNQMSDLYIGNLQSGSYKRFLVLKRVEDETNINLTFKKRNGITSDGFIIPQNLSPDVFKNIDTITKELKQKIPDQSQININTF